MKLTILAVAAGLLMAATSPAFATCKNLAQNCVRNGGAHDVCFGAAYRECQKTGVYVGPNTGKKFYANPRRKGAATSSAKRSANPHCPYGYGACLKFLMQKGVLGRDAEHACSYYCQ